MFLQQTFVSYGRALPAIIAPAIILDLDLDPAWIGAYFGLSAFAAVVSNLGCGSLIVRHGALRVSQMALVLLAVGTALLTLGTPLALVLSAIICGGGTSPSTPASSHLLARCTAPKYLPLVFSIKQTSVPVGLLLAGILAPLLTELTGWRTTMLASAMACLIYALLLQPVRGQFDADREPMRSFRMSDFHSTLVSVIKAPDMRALSLACLAFNGVQATFTAYFVLYLTTIGYTPVAAGFVFSVAVAVAVPGRILWGWLGSVRVAPHQLLAGLAFTMTASVMLLALFVVGWPTLLVGLIACVLGATALSWHGVLLAEAANMAPERMRGSVTGGVLSFGQVGASAFPLVYSALLNGTGSYGFGFVVCGVPALLIGLQLLRKNRRPGNAV